MAATFTRWVTADADLGRRLLVKVAEVFPGLHNLRTIARWRAGCHFVAVVGVVVDEGRVLVAEHRFRGNHIALIGGWVQSGEDPIHALRREIREEVGAEVVIGDLLGWDQHALAGGVTYSGITLALRCALIGPAPTVRSVELTSITWMTVDEARRTLTDFEGRMVDLALSAGVGTASTRGS